MRIDVIKTSRILAITGSIFGLLAVVIGAFGAHVLKNKITPALFPVFETGVQYQFYHCLAILYLSIIAEKKATIIIRYSGLCFILGIVLFSFSLYLLAITGIHWIGIITPIGGVLLITGWILLLITTAGL